MKRAISVLLALTLVLSLFTAAFAYVDIDTRRDEMPVVLITGDAEPIYDADDNRVFQIGELGDTFDNVEDGNLKESMKNVLLPFLTKGLIGGDYDEYYEKLEEEIGELFQKVRLDENGDPQYGTGISSGRRESMLTENIHDVKDENGTYGCYDYHFWYDWRLDPMETADKLHDYICTVKEVTGAERVGLISACLGTNVSMAYIAKYSDAFPLELNGFAVNAALINGSEFMSEAISGKFRLNGNSMRRLLIDATEWGWLDVPEIVIETIDLAQKSGALDHMSDFVRKTLYDKMVEGVTSALALATFFTMPGYWACISADRYDEAIHYVFGDEGSAKRRKYAGLIEKLDNYHNTVSTHVPELMRSIHDNNVNLCITAKYGFQMVAIGESNEVIGDQFSSLTSSSFGATTANTIYETLPEDYIAQRVAEGKGKYISPDKQVDASTCLYPDLTWFVKGASHSERTGYEDDIMFAAVTSDRELTIDDIKYTQFMVYYKDANTMEPMTEENCHTELWTADYEEDHPKTIFQKLTALLRSIKRFLPVFFAFVKEKLTK